MYRQAIFFLWRNFLCSYSLHRESTPLDHIFHNKKPWSVSNIQKIDVEPLITEFSQIYAQVKDLKETDILDNSSPELYAVFKRLDELVSLDIDEQSIEVLFESPDFNILIAEISRFRFLYNLKLEIEKAKSLLESSNPWQTLHNFTFYPNYLQLASTEYTGSGLKPKDCVLFLGSGPLPLSLIMLCREHGLFGIGIEQDGKRASLSREVIACLGLSESIEIIEGNHFILPLKTRCDLYMGFILALSYETKASAFVVLIN